MSSKKKPPSVTMKEVAQRAGVSSATVSRVLKVPEKVSHATRLLVEQAASELGYMPQALNRHLKNNMMQIVLVIAADVCDPVFSDIISGIENTAARRGYLVIVGDCSHQDKQEKSFINLIINKGIAGVLLCNGRLPLFTSREERAHLPPMVMVNSFAQRLGLPSVSTDNLTAAFYAVNYLYQLGHQRVACIAESEEISVYQYRLQGYLQALTRHGYTPDPHYIVRANNTYQAGANALAQLLMLPKPPTAVFCHCDVTALGALAYAKQQGLHVPRDLSIMGFDNIMMAEFSDPPLTTMAQPRFDIGREAMLLLIEQMSGKKADNSSRLLDCQLIVRGSTCPPRVV